MSGAKRPGVAQQWGAALYGLLFVIAIAAAVVIAIKAGSVVIGFVAALLIAGALTLASSLWMVPAIRRDRRRIDQGEKP